MVCTIDQWGTQAIDVCVCFSGPFPLILSPFNTFSKAADAATAANARSFVDDPDCTPRWLWKVGEVVGLPRTKMEPVKWSPLCKITVSRT